ncbi:MAG: helix-turn-helix domain-containing protein [Ktedonobacterales bacterium]
MATDGTPEPAAKRCGEAIARLRTARRWSRAQFVIRLFDELAADDPNYNSISETWLARLENGRMVKVPRQTVDAICRALRCTPQERALVLVHADRSVLTDHTHKPTVTGELLTFVMDRLHTEARDVLETLAGHGDVTTLDELEMLEMAATALDLLIARRRKQRSSGLPTHGAISARDGHLTLVPAVHSRTGA